jgi:hypothetical protein
MKELYNGVEPTKPNTRTTSPILYRYMPAEVLSTTTSQRLQFVCKQSCRAWFVA